MKSVVFSQNISRNTSYEGMREDTKNATSSHSNYKNIKSSHIDTFKNLFYADNTNIILFNPLCNQNDSQKDQLSDRKQNVHRGILI
jgi:hypothetical protein